jgi:hypothetical protein
VPRTAITPQKATSAGPSITFEPANNLGNSFTPQKGRALIVRNGSGSTVTLTLPTPGTADGLAIADRTVSVAAAAQAHVGLGAFAGIYGQADGSVNVDYSAVTSVTVAVVDNP